MCTVVVPEVPTVETLFYLDSCACHSAPREMVEVWRPGYGAQLTAVYRVDEVRRQRPGLWSAIQSRHASWRALSYIEAHTLEPIDDHAGRYRYDRLAPADVGNRLLGPANAALAAPSEH